MPSDQFHRIEKLVGNCEDWHEVGESGEPAFENSWVNYGSGFESAGFYKDPFGRVHLKGMVDNGTDNATVFTLPEGYRPALRELFVTQISTGSSRIDVTTAGVVSTLSAGAHTWLTLSGISFRV